MGRKFLISNIETMKWKNIFLARIILINGDETDCNPFRISRLALKADVGGQGNRNQSVVQIRPRGGRSVFIRL